MWTKHAKGKSSAAKLTEVCTFCYIWGLHVLQAVQYYITMA